MRILLTNGEYSDYAVDGLYEMPSVDWLREKLEEWLAQHPDQRERYHFREREFVQWLETFQECVQLPYREAHIGSYSTAELRVYEDQLMADGGSGL
jgi:hypothetical protein